MSIRTPTLFLYKTYMNIYMNPNRGEIAIESYPYPTSYTWDDSCVLACQVSTLDALCEIITEYAISLVQQGHSPIVYVPIDGSRELTLPASRTQPARRVRQDYPQVKICAFKFHLNAHIWEVFCWLAKALPREEGNAPSLFSR